MCTTDLMRLKRLRLVTNGFAIFERCAANFGETHIGMKNDRSGIGRVKINLASNPFVPRRAGFIKQLGIIMSRKPFAAGVRRNDNPVDIDKSVIPSLEPLEINAVIGRVLIERNQQPVGVVGYAEKRIGHHLFK